MPRVLDDVLKSPVRVRILGWLAGQRDPRTKKAAGRTKREIGRALSLSNASVHYHVARLEKAGLVTLDSTRPGPNGITEKLYTGTSVTERKQKPLTGRDRDRFYLRFTLDSISEMHREGEALINADWDSCRFAVGCYGVHATEKDLKGLKTRLTKLLEEFYESHKSRRAGTAPFSITFGLTPSSGLGWKDTTVRGFEVRL
jgi:DNA-binding transcriptional ArsR family regulator